MVALMEISNAMAIIIIFYNIMNEIFAYFFVRK
jgi:hypothetical protein